MVRNGERSGIPVGSLESNVDSEWRKLDICSEASVYKGRKRRDVGEKLELSMCRGIEKVRV